MATTKPPKLKDIAARLYEHLKRFERDPKINVMDPKSRLHPYYNANAWSGGAYVYVRYVSFQNEWRLTKDDAIAYLAWLDAGNVGKTFEWENSRQ